MGDLVNILLLTAHDIAEYDDLRMLTDLGYDVFSIGAYTDPTKPASEMRPALDVPTHDGFEALCNIQRELHAGDPMTVPMLGEEHNVVDWAKADLHPDIIEWADVIVCHHYLIPWVWAQWDRIKHKRVIWRTCGQSNARLEEVMGDLRKQGLQIVRYSPKEEVAFTRLGVYAGADALIRFGKYPSDYGPWNGEDKVVGNLTQNMAGRGQFCGLSFWDEATVGLPSKPAGLQSEALPNGIGGLTYDEMLAYLRDIRVHLYTGTQPASYTLSLIEAMMTGVPTVSIGPEYMWMPDLFEGHELAGNWSNSARTAGLMLRTILDDDEMAAGISVATRERAIAVWGMDTVGPQWVDFLGKP